jgi:hypothetical protein
LLLLRKALHRHDVEFPASLFAQFGEGTHEAFMVIRDEMSFNGLARDVCDDDIFDTTRPR